MKSRLLVIYLILVISNGIFSQEKTTTGEKSADKTGYYTQGSSGEKEKFLKKIPVPKEWWDENRERDKRDKPEEHIRSLNIKPGMKIGEAGAGDGYFTLFLSNAVGEKGVIYANDNDRFMLYALEYYMNVYQKYKNIIPVLGSDVDPLFPINDLDMIVIYGSFHDFQDRKEWLNNAKKYLKRKGVLAISDGYWPQHGALTYKSIIEITKECGFKQFFYRDFSSSDFSHHLHAFMKE